MANSPQLPFFAQNSTVKAWCHTSVTNVSMFGFNDETFNKFNFVDGYNLRLDGASWIFPGGGTSVLGKPHRFSFSTPMQDTKYKIFIQPVFRRIGGDDRPAYAHALNSTQFPKLTTSFWIRIGVPTNSISTPDPNKVRAITFDPASNIQIRVVVL
jgi:hypothetical protein